MSQEERLNAAIKRCEGLDERLGALMAENDTLRRKCSDAESECSMRVAAAIEKAAKIIKQAFDACEIDTGRIPLSHVLKQVRSLLSEPAAKLLEERIQAEFDRGFRTGLSHGHVR